MKLFGSPFSPFLQLYVHCYTSYELHIQSGAFQYELLSWCYSLIIASSSCWLCGIDITAHNEPLFYKLIYGTLVAKPNNPWLIVHFSANYRDWSLRYLLWNCPPMNVTRLTDDESTTFQVMAWCRHATSHCLSQCWTMSPYNATSPQWVIVI